MKYVFILTNLFLIIACSGRKSTLVNEQKMIKDSIASIEGQVKVQELKIQYGSLDTSAADKYPDLKKLKDEMDIAVSPEISVLKKRLREFEKKYDSIEFELKRY